MDSERVVELVIALEDEVNNGGFHQYFNNSAGDNAIETIYALESMGAVGMAKILKRAIAMFPGGAPPKDREMRLDTLWRKFPETDEFRELDNRFLAYPDDLSRLISDYMKA